MVKKSKNNIITARNDFDEEEREVIDILASKKYQYSADEKEEVRKARKAAKNYVSKKKDMRINIRLSSHDLDAIKDVADYEGIPYQTLVSSILHKFAGGKLVDRYTE